MKPLVLLPGWGFDARIWQGLLAALPAADGEIDVLHASPTRCPPADLPEACVLCGWSLGALVALDWARQSPGRCAGLVLIAATPRFTQAEDWPYGLPAEALTDFRQSLSDDAPGLQRRFAALIASGDERRKELLLRLPELFAFHATASADLFAGLDLLARLDLRPAVGALDTPTLLLHGEHDALMPLAAARWLAGHLPQARLEVLPGCGHAPLLSRPADCAAALIDLLHD